MYLCAHHSHISHTSTHAPMEGNRKLGSDSSITLKKCWGSLGLILPETKCLFSCQWYHPPHVEIFAIVKHEKKKSGTRFKADDSLTSKFIGIKLFNNYICVYRKVRYVCEKGWPLERKRSPIYMYPWFCN